MIIIITSYFQTFYFMKVLKSMIVFSDESETLSVKLSNCVVNTSNSS